eukprot:CAMPEP_0203764732 /NCGR_PEP_ID=MMETSP0098-20131031/18012_1 /ASSEMBLY_ACC=CAM_ASM_000208 /TAXON_ID=96639 /ORGANISM=" , Strain NY0313808BC1" /LENGTH=48 /DNA_ID= /DNA_START= /DNA_END= /DNA_ORIENTATION=
MTDKLPYAFATTPILTVPNGQLFELPNSTRTHDARVSMPKSLHKDTHH